MQQVVGSSLRNKTYLPVLGYNLNIKEFKILTDPFVTSDSGTGIVHLAPAFGEDDYRVCSENKIIDSSNIFIPVDSNGRYDKSVPDYQGRLVFESSSDIIKVLEKNDLLFSKKNITHSYPFCWRSEQKLIYLACPAWFIKVTELKDVLVANNDQVNWVPDHVGKVRFKKWLENAKDWNISRNRFWGTPIPLWVSEDFSEVRIIGSADELARASGIKVTDLHRENIDHITIPSKKGNPPLKRIDEVFDCWFESGSMPFARNGYPYHGKTTQLPADFISEGLDQTRGWFYTLLVISTALTGKSPFSNVIVNGLVLAEDGKKMSKSLSNYPDITKVINTYGADALRVYLLSSGAVMAEPLKFSEEGVKNILKISTIPLLNAIKFFEEHHTYFKKCFHRDISKTYESKNVMDQWILSELVNLKKKIRDDMEDYKLNKIGMYIFHFIDMLNNWFIKFNRRRMKNRSNIAEFDTSLSILHNVVLYLSVIISPFYPHLSEYIYQKFRVESAESVHLYYWVNLPTFRYDHELDDKFSLLRQVCNYARTYRGKNNVSLKKPFQEVSIWFSDPGKADSLASLVDYLKESINATIIHIDQKDIEVVYTAQFNYKEYGKRWGRDAKKIMAEVMDDLNLVIEKGGAYYKETWFQVGRELILTPELKTTTTGEYLPEINAIIDISKEIDNDMYCVALISHEIQQFRKELDLHIWDKIEIYLESSEKATSDFLERSRNNYTNILETKLSIGTSEGQQKTISIQDHSIIITIKIL